MLKSEWLFVAGLAISSCLLPAQAQILYYDLSGSVEQVTDNDGVLGSPSAGTPFRLIYLADYSVGMRNGGGGGFGSSNFLVGGTSFPESEWYPTIQISPVSAVLEINGHALNFSGQYYGRVEYTQNWFDVQFGGYSHSWAELSATNRLDDSSPVLSEINTSLDSPYSSSTFGSTDSLLSLVIDGSSITGSIDFKYLWAPGTADEKLISGILTPATYVVTHHLVTAVPLPAGWLLLASGLAGLHALGHACRRTRRSP